MLIAKMPLRGLITMPLLTEFGIVLMAGAVGGAINAFISDNGFALPREEYVNNVTIFRPGFIGNIIIGAIASLVAWGLYGSYGSTIIYGPQVGAGAEDIGISLSTLASSLIVGIGGARTLTNEVDKSLLKIAAVTAAASNKSYNEAQRIAVSTPAQAFSIAKQMYLEG